MAEPHSKPDFLQGVPLDMIPAHGVLAGMIGRTEALLVRDGDRIRAIGARCTHLDAPLAEGLVVDGEIRCPWHHACFALDSGSATRAPAFDPLPTWPVTIENGRARVSHAEPAPAAARPMTTAAAGPFVIVGGGAAGYAAAVALREAAPNASCTLLSEDEHAPYDRTILTKDYLDGKFGDDRLPISRKDLAKLGVNVGLSTSVARIDRARRQVVLESGEVVPYAKLLIATGSTPRRPDVPGASQDHVKVLRSLADCRSILARLGTARQVVVIGGSFIGLEVAASLLSRGVAVTVVAPEQEPTATLFGAEIAKAILAVHRSKGVGFALGRTVSRIGPDDVTLDNGAVLAADLVIAGIGVSPRTELAIHAGLRVEDGITVDHTLATSDPDIFAAGDVACWPDHRTGKTIRVEHWVVAQRQGQVAAVNMLGGALSFTGVPFFWTKHFDLSVRYVGHAGPDAATTVDGSPADRDATVVFRRDSRTDAVATLGRDCVSLDRELAMERMTQP